MDSLSNFPEYIATGAPLLLGAIALIAVAIWLAKTIKRKRGDS